MILVGDRDSVDFRSWNGSARVVVEHGALCASCTEPIRRDEPALFRWWRTARRSKVDWLPTTGAELVHVACVAPPRHASGLPF